MKTFFRTLACVLCVCLLVCLSACADDGPSPNPQPSGKVYSFDYKNTDMSQYVRFPETDYRAVTFTTAPCATVSDEDARATFNSYFSNANNQFFLAIEDAEKPIAKGDILYLRYCGVLQDVLEQAVAEGKITDAGCSGLTYEQIAALKLGFEGGTSSGITHITVGSAGYIAGFEDGLVGLVPAEHGADAPYPLHVTFPEGYGNADLKGKDATFFCDLVYIGAGETVYSWDNMTVDLVNRFLCLTGEDAYTDMQACHDRIKQGMERDARTAYESARRQAMWSALVEAAAFTSVPEEAIGMYLQQWLAGQLDQAMYYYQNNINYYQYVYATNVEPTAAIILRCMDPTMNEENYIARLSEAATPAVKQDMVFYYILQVEKLSLSEEEYTARRADYTAQYGAAIFEGVSDDVIRDQFLYDKLCESLIANLDEKGLITYADETT